MARLRALVDAYPIVLFMKGTLEHPMCGYSARAATALRDAGATRLHAVNVMADPEVRAQLPKLANWPTFPQLFVHGELIGGCDITEELLAAGELARIVADVEASA